MPLTRTGEATTYDLPEMSATTGSQATTADFVYTYLLAALEHGDQDGARAWCDAFGASLWRWYRDPNTQEFDHTFIAKDRTAVIAVRGTENVWQWVSYLWSLTPIYNRGLRGWTLPPFYTYAMLQYYRLQERHMLDGDFHTWKIAAHSGGAAACYILSLLMKKEHPDWNIQLRTYGENKSIGSHHSQEPDSHVRVVACSDYSKRPVLYDMVPFVPPGVAIYPNFAKWMQQMGSVAPIVKWDLGISPEPHGTEINIDSNGNYHPMNRSFVDEFFRKLAGSLILDSQAIFRLHLLDASYFRRSFYKYREDTTQTPLPELFAKSMFWLDNYVQPNNTGVPMNLTYDQIQTVFNNWKTAWLTQHQSWNGVTPSGRVPDRPSAANLIFTVVQTAVSAPQMMASFLNLPQWTALLRQTVLDSWQAAITLAIANAAQSPDVAGGSWDDGGTADWGDDTDNYPQLTEPVGGSVPNPIGWVPYPDQLPSYVNPILTQPSTPNYGGGSVANPQGWTPNDTSVNPRRHEGIRIVKRRAGMYYVFNNGSRIGVYKTRRAANAAATQLILETTE